MNKILENILKERGNYCHVIEVGTTYEIESCVEQLLAEFIGTYTDKDIIDFFESLLIVYYVDEDDPETMKYVKETDENEVDNFNMAEHLKKVMD